jgi:DNA processing protein
VTKGGPPPTRWLPDDVARPDELRRPADLAAEIPGRTRGRGWQVGAAASATVTRTAADRRALLVLLSLPSLTAGRLSDLSARYGSATACLGAVRRGEGASLRDQRKARLLDPGQVETALEAVGARAIAPADVGYPSELHDLADPPAGLFVRGRPLDDHRGVAASVAIVGSRTCSPGGAEMAAALAGALVRAGCRVVSGAAFGIDAAAHRGALDACGDTVAVLGCGIDVVYPRSNRQLFVRLAEEGTVLAEYPPGTPPEPFRFPARNRLVAALSRAVVVVEGADGSGSMITAEFALDMGRDVLAVPGPVTSELSQVPHRLIREGATLIRGPEDLLDDLGIRPLSRSRVADETGDPGVPGDTSMPDLPAQAHRVLDAVAGLVAPDRVAAQLGLPLGQVLANLTELELRGLVRSSGGRFERRLAARVRDR